MKITMILIEKNKSSREILIDLINQEKDIEIVGEADHLQPLITEITSQRPDVIIIDIGSKYCPCLKSVKDILARKPDQKIICLSMISEELFVKQVFQAGVHGYVLTNCAYHELSDAIRKVLKGEIYISSEIDFNG